MTNEIFEISNELRRALIKARPIILKDIRSYLNIKKMTMADYARELKYSTATVSAQLRSPHQINCRFLIIVLRNTDYDFHIDPSLLKIVREMDGGIENRIEFPEFLEAVRNYFDDNPRRYEDCRLLRLTPAIINEFLTGEQRVSIDFCHALLITNHSYFLQFIHLLPFVCRIKERDHFNFNQHLWTVKDLREDPDYQYCDPVRLLKKKFLKLLDGDEETEREDLLKMFGELLEHPKLRTITHQHIFNESNKMLDMLKGITNE